jgi:uncharacterized protein (DUF2336 family)
VRDFSSGVSVSSEDFRQIAEGDGPARAERLFRAAVSAFAALSRPGKVEIAQLDDLAQPLFDAVSPEARRYAAAVLSDCAAPPPALLQRLAAQPAEIAAPLLLRSPALSETELLALALRFGAAHARVIAGRADLGARVRRRIARIAAMHAPSSAMHEKKGKPMPEAPTMSAETYRETAPPPRVEAVREQLRAMMLPASETTALRGPGQRPRPAESVSQRAACFDRLRTAALSGTPGIFAAALGDMLGLERARARSLFCGSDYFHLLAALKLLDFSAEQAFTLAAALQPGRFADTASIRLFLERFRLLEHGRAAERVAAWRACVPALLPADPALHAPGREPAMALRAS